jgi:hypothetical protein
MMVRRGLPPLALLAGTTLAVTGIAAPARAGAQVTSRACAPATLAVSFGTSGLDASHVNAFLVFTNTASVACTLSGYPTVHYVTKSGTPIGNPSQPAAVAHGPVTLGKGQSAHSLLRSSVPGVWPAAQCMATQDYGIQVLAPGSTHAKMLHFPESVCAGLAIHESTTAPVSPGRGPVPSACRAAQLTDTLGQSQGALGTIYVPVVFTNTTVDTCTLRGHPKVTSVHGATHAQVGPAAASDPGTARTIWVQPFGGTASAALGVVETGNFPASACVPKSASGVRVTPPHTGHATVLAYPHTVCTHLASTHVSAVVAGSLG